jgi:hypothetical protein
MIYKNMESTSIVVLQNSRLEHTFYKHTLVRLSARVSELSSKYDVVGPTMLVEWLDD